MGAGAFSRRRVIELIQVDEGFLVQLEEASLIEAEPSGSYSVQAVEQIRLCHTLCHELGVNLPGAEVALHLLRRIQAERAMFQRVRRELEARLGEDR